MEYRQDSATEFKKRAADLVLSHFKRTGQGILLSRLGQELQRTGLDLASYLDGRKLFDVLTSELSGEIGLARSPTNPQLVIATPLGGAAAQIDVSRTTSLPRIAPAIWAAFVKPIGEGRKRLLCLDPPTFRDVDEREDTQQPALAAGDVFPRPAEMPREDYNQQVFSRIEAWLAKQGTSIEQATAEAVHKKSPHEGSSLFDQLVEALSTDQLRRCSLPLDVVAALKKR